VQQSKTRKKLGSYPSVGVVISITLALCVIGLFGLLIISSQELERIVRENIEVQVYLKNNLTETQRTQIEKKFQQLPYINQNLDQKEVISFISKDSAAKDMIKETGEDFQQLLGENPLHDAYIIKIGPAYHSQESLDKISSEIAKMNGIFEVRNEKKLIDKINSNFTKLGFILAVIIALLLITVVLLINSTLRLALFSQRFLIRSMQLVGARNWFILRPFLMRAILYGLLSGILAGGAIWLLVNQGVQYIEDLSLIINKSRMITLSISLGIVGMIVSVISSYFAIRKYLKMSLDELY
jgi:cell division transport system permease protein